MKTKPLLHKKQ